MPEPKQHLKKVTVYLVGVENPYVIWFSLSDKAYCNTFESWDGIRNLMVLTVYGRYAEFQNVSSAIFEYFEKDQ